MVSGIGAMTIPAALARGSLLFSRLQIREQTLNPFEARLPLIRASQTGSLRRFFGYKCEHRATSDLKGLSRSFG